MNPDLTKFPQNFPWKITRRQAGLIAWYSTQWWKHLPLDLPPGELEALIRRNKFERKLAQSFSMLAYGHLCCRKKQCRRAKRCDRWTLECTRAFEPRSEDELSGARVWFRQFRQYAEEQYPAPPVVQRDSSKG